MLLHKQLIKKSLLRKIYTDIRTESLRFSVEFKYTICILRNYKKVRKGGFDLG